MTAAEHYMGRALELAVLGLGSASPNPLVGCVIVKDDRIIGEGWHRKFGEGHAEVNAVRSVKDQAQIQGSDIYVTLEPCSHHGKTPPCADLLTRLKPKQVFVCNQDPNPKVAGRGIQKLHEAGISVRIGILAERGQVLNRRFFARMHRDRPYIILKWAQTRDGFIARQDGTSKWISGSHSRRLVHKWRTEEDAIMVGTGTVLIDDPRLDARDWPGRSPIRVLLDRQGRIPAHFRLFDRSIPTICFTQLPKASEPNLTFLPWPDRDGLHLFFEEMSKQGIGSVIVEGGSKLLASIVQEGLWDEARVFTAPVRFGRGLPAPYLVCDPIWEEGVGRDLLSIFRRRD